MHIWYINHYSGGPNIGPAFRSFHLAKAWLAQGHQPTVIMAGFHHLMDRTPLSRAPTVEDILYLLLPARRYVGNGVSRILNMADFCRGVGRLAERVPAQLAKPDAIIASSPHPFSVVPAARLAKKYNATLVFEIRDLWPLSITEITGASRFHPFTILCAAAERYAYRRANLVSSVLPRAERYLDNVGMGHKPFVWVPNGIDITRPLETTASSTSAHTALKVIRDWKQEGRSVVIHVGSMGAPNGLLELLDAIETESARKCTERYGVILVGSGTLEREIKRRAEQVSSNVKVVGRVPKSDVHAILREADIGYCGLVNRERLYQYGVSLNKFGDYMRAGLPSLLPVAPCGDPISQSGAGIAVAARSPDELWSGLLSLIDMSDQERRVLGEKARKYIEREYNVTDIARRYIDAITNAAPPST